MASGSTKKLAVANTKTLNQLHLITLIINVISIFVIFVFKRPSSYKPWLILSIPSFIIEYNLEKSGRPKYVTEGSGVQKLIRSGDDIHQSGGLFEYFFDVVYLTWGFNILMIVIGSNKIWWLYLIIPGFVIYKLYGIVSPFILKRKESAQAVGEDQQQQQQQQSSGTSKRQQKLQARREKGTAVKYR